MHACKGAVVGSDACDPVGRARAREISQHLVASRGSHNRARSSDEAHACDGVRRVEKLRNSMRRCSMHIVIACDASAVFQCEGSCMSYMALLQGHLVVYDGEPHPGYARAHPINVPQCSSSRRPGSATSAARIKTILLVYIRYTSRVCAVPVPQKPFFW